MTKTCCVRIHDVPDDANLAIICSNGKDKIQSAPKTCSTKGTFTLKLLPNCPYLCRIRKAGYLPVSWDFNTSAAGSSQEYWAPPLIKDKAYSQGPFKREIIHNDDFLSLFQEEINNIIGTSKEKYDPAWITGTPEYKARIENIESKTQAQEKTKSFENISLDDIIEELNKVLGNVHLTF